MEVEKVWVSNDGSVRVFQFHRENGPTLFWPQGDVNEYRKLESVERPEKVYAFPADFTELSRKA